MDSKKRRPLLESVSLVYVQVLKKIAATAWRVLSVAALLSPPVAWGSFISSADLFLAPSQVPTAIYAPFNVSPGGSLTFSVSNVPGATQLLGLHILPVLNPDPFALGGAYTTSDLAGINVLNFSSYYAFQPNMDYFATTIGGNSSDVTLNASGSYYVELHTTDGTSEKDTFFRVQASDFLGEDPAAGVQDATGADRKLTLPATDLTIISDGDPNDKGFLTNAAKQFPNAVRAKSVQEVVDAIKKYYNDHGQKKFEVMIIGHGRSGSIKIGTERINNGGDGTVKPADFQKSIDSFVSSIHFFSCNTALDAAGAQFLKDIVASVPTVTAYNDYVTAADSYFDIGAKGKAISGTDIVPEPSTLVLIMPVALLVLALRRVPPWAPRKIRARTT
jgi:hypothetical protein